MLLFKTLEDTLVIVDSGREESLFIGEGFKRNWAGAGQVGLLLTTLALTVICSTVLWRSEPCVTVYYQCSAVQCSAVQCSAMTHIAVSSGGHPTLCPKLMASTFS